MSDDDSSKSVEMDFCRDSGPTVMDRYCDNVLSKRQQIIMDKLKIDLCHEDLIYLNNHKEVNISDS